MNNDQFRREKEYGAAAAVAGALLRQNLITESEYRKIKAVLTEKYRPVIGCLQTKSMSNFPKEGD